MSREAVKRFPGGEGETSGGDVDTARREGIHRLADKQDNLFLIGAWDANFVLRGRGPHH